MTCVSTSIPLAPSNSRLRLLHIPRELRNLILNFLFAQGPDGSDFERRIEWERTIRILKPCYNLMEICCILGVRGFPILLTNHQLGAEALEELFKCQTVQFLCGPQALFNILDSLPQAQLNWLTSIELGWPTVAKKARSEEGLNRIYEEEVLPLFQYIGRFTAIRDVITPLPFCGVKPSCAVNGLVGAPKIDDWRLQYWLCVAAAASISLIEGYVDKVSFRYTPVDSWAAMLPLLTPEQIANEGPLARDWRGTEMWYFVDSILEEYLSIQVSVMDLVDSWELVPASPQFDVVHFEHELLIHLQNPSNL